MRWTKENEKEVIELLKSKKSYIEIGIEINRSEKSVKEKLNRLGYNQVDYVKRVYYESKKCLCCDEEFSSLISEERKFCNHSCSAIFNNKLKVKDRKCLNCEKVFERKKGWSTRRYCDTKCQAEYYRKQKFELIEGGDASLSTSWYKKYLIHKHGEKCMECGWCEVSKYSGNVPIELEHIDGDSENNSLENLKLLCPNCHSLTPIYKALNAGNGRHSRRKRYEEGKSY